MDAKWLNDQFQKNPDRSKGDLSQLLGIQASGISKMLAGTRQIKAREYMLMRKFFDQSVSQQSSFKNKSDIQSYADLAAEDSARQDWSPKSSATSYQIIEVSDASMLPDFLPGERVLIDSTSSLHAKSGIFAIEESGRVFIRIAEVSSPSKIKLSSIAKDSASRIVSANRVKILGRVIAKLNWL